MDKIGNLKREKKVFRSRVLFSVVIMLSMTLILTLRLFNLQITNSSYLYHLQAPWCGQLFAFCWQN